MQGLLIDNRLANYSSINLIFTVTIIPHQNPDRLNKKLKNIKSLTTSAWRCIAFIERLRKYLREWKQVINSLEDSGNGIMLIYYLKSK